MRLSRVSLFIGFVLAVTLCCFLYPSTTLASDDFEIIEIEIDVAPNVLNIQSKSVVVTVHTNIAYRVVKLDELTVYFNDVEIYINYSKQDARGNFVAKFLSDEIKELASEEYLSIGKYNTLELTGLTTDDEEFIGEQDILVIDILPQGKE